MKLTSNFRFVTLIAEGNWFFHAEAQRTQSQSNKIFDFTTFV